MIAHSVIKANMWKCGRRNPDYILQAKNGGIKRMDGSKVRRWLGVLRRGMGCGIIEVQVKNTTK